VELSSQSRHLFAGQCVIGQQFQLFERTGRGAVVTQTGNCAGQPAAATANTVTRLFAYFVECLMSHSGGSSTLEIEKREE
jgi:hypothetical protein